MQRVHHRIPRGGAPIGGAPHGGTLLASILLLTLAACSSSTPTARDADSQGDGGPRGPLIFVQESISEAVRDSLPQYRASDESCIVYQHFIDDPEDGVFDGEEHLTQGLTSGACADPDLAGPLVLDWEGSWMPRLEDTTDPADKAEAIRQGVLALEAAARLRPHALIGYYALPPRRYWQRDDPDWRGQAESLRLIYDASTALYPSVYDFYVSSETGEGADTRYADDQAYVADNVELALELAGNLPVYPYVWGRYHPSNTDATLEPIPPEELESHVRGVALASFEGRRTAGVIWWGADTYFFRPAPASDFTKLHLGQLRAIHRGLTEP